MCAYLLTKYLHFDTGAFFYDKALCYLIKLRTEFNTKFDSSSYRNKALWEIISQKINEAGHPFTALQCEDKMDRLIDQYKLFEENVIVTGNNECMFDYVEEMRGFMGDLVNVHPEATFSFGCMAVKTQNEVISSKNA